MESRIRYNSINKTNPTEELTTNLNILKKLHKARKKLDQAAQEFQACADAATKNCSIDIFDAINCSSLHTPPDQLLELSRIDSIAKRISEIASWYFSEGEAYELTD